MELGIDRAPSTRRRLQVPAVRCPGVGRYYDEDRMADLRDAFEEHVLDWPGVTTQVMFGCPAYQVRGDLFAFLVTEGLVVTKLDAGGRHTLEQDHAAGPFEAGQRTMASWSRVPIHEVADLEELLEHVRASYEAARG